MRILIADDEPRFGRLLADRLEEDGHLVTTVTSAGDALEELINGYDILLTDLRMNDLDGVELTRRAKSSYPSLVIILMTAYAAFDTAVAAMKAGAVDYIQKPFEFDEMAVIVRKFAKFKSKKTRPSDEFVIGQSSAMRAVSRLIEKAASSEVTVLLLGETGTGKEVAALAIHSRSKRSKHPFVPVNCAALSRGLLESELFGHERGAFTGAYKTKPGWFELAEGGTLFLDEIGELSQDLQAKLLRTIQDKTIYRVGGTSGIKVDIRLMVATNRDLEAEVKIGRFREDLYYRVAVFPIKMPPLSERREDIPALTHYFLQKAEFKSGISDTAIECLIQKPWPGNVRELFNALECAMIFSGGGRIEASHLPRESGVNTPSRTLDQLEKEALIEAVRHCSGNKSKAARMLGITRRMVYSRMKKLGLDEENLKP